MRQIQHSARLPGLCKKASLAKLVNKNSNLSSTNLPINIRSYTEVYMNKHIQRYSKTLGFVLLFFSILFLTACKIDDPQQITINLTAPVEIQNNAIVSTKSQSNTKEIIEINSHCSKYNCVLALLFSEKDGGLNQNKELNTYITMTFIDSLDDKTIQNIISDLEQLDVVETAYQAPKGEDAGMSLPEY